METLLGKRDNGQRSVSKKEFEKEGHKRARIALNSQIESSSDNITTIIGGSNPWTDH